MGENTKDPMLQKIWDLRTRKGLSQEDLARVLGIKQTTYSAMETGTNRMFVDHLVKIAEALEVSVADLIRDTNPEVGPLDNNEKSLVLNLRDVAREDERMTQIVFKLAKSLTEEIKKKSHR